MIKSEVSNLIFSKPFLNMKTLYILDAAGYLYRSYFAIRNMTNAKGESTNALFGFIRSVLKLFKDFHPHHFIAVFDGPNNAAPRKKIYEHYKAHRASMPPDLLYQIEWAKNFCRLMQIPYLDVPNVEADDTMGSIATWAADQGAQTYLCTSDKDLCQFVSPKIAILNTYKENLIIGPSQVEEEWGVTPEQIVDLLAIIGDASDNIPGLTGFGPKTAAALLKQFGSLENLLLHPEQLSGKKREIVAQEADKARMSRQLVLIDTSVDFPKSPDFFSLKSPHIAQLREFYAEMGFHSLIRELEESQPLVSSSSELGEEVRYLLIDEEQAFNELVILLNKQKEICFDTETTDLRPIKAELVGVGFCMEAKTAYYVPVNGRLGLEKVLKALKPVFENKDIGFYGHNVKYDYHVLQNYGIDIGTIAFDTILASYILNAHQRQHSLDYLALDYFGKIKTPIDSLIGKGKKTISMKDVSIEKVCLYCCEDVDYTFRLKLLLEGQLKERGLLKLLQEIELPLLVVLAKMERNGIYVDVPYLKSMSQEIALLINELENQIFTMAGKTFNLNSPKQLSEILFNQMGIKPPKKTATGFSTNADVLESLKLIHPIAGKISEYRQLEKLRSTYIDTLPSEVNPNTSRIHCNFNQSVAATGRLSSQDPNLQNIPVRTEIGRKIRKAFKPQKEGWSYLSADYSQIELRLLAHLSEDPTLIEAFLHNEDIHRHTAANIFNIALHEVTKEQRYQAKAVNFGVIYGQQAFGLSQELGIDMKEASRFIDMYFQRYRRVKQFIEECKVSAKQSGKSVTLTGRERLIPEIHSKNAMLRIAAERLAVNTPLQGTAADLIKLAMLKLQQLLEQKKLKSYLVLQIHDELLLEIPEEEKEEVASLVKHAMEGVWHLRVPLLVDITLGKNWEEC